jgi:transposase InsO family protein
MSLTACILACDNNTTTVPTYIKKYKKVANRTYPVKGTLPEEFRIVRRKHPNPLDDITPLPTHPPEFQPGEIYTQERKDKHLANHHDFLTPDEERLVHHLIKLQEKAFAWEEVEKGRFFPEFFDPILLPTIEHVPWALKNIPIPPGIREQVIKLIRDKIAAGVYEQSNSSYRSRWFCVPKKDGKSLRLVHDLTPLNKVSIRDASVPPVTEQFAESFAGRACYASFDLFVSFDQRSLDPRCRDLTTFQTPLGAKRLTCIPMGYTNSTQIMHGDVSHILEDEIPEVTSPFIDDVPVKGPATRYELPDGSYETIPENPHIRRFVWEHLNNCNRILQRMKKVGGTFNGKKTVMCAPKIEVVGHVCCYEGRIPDDSRVQRVRDWPTPEDLTQVRSFLGFCGVLRIFIKDYASLARPLVNLTKKDAPFEFGLEEQQSMDNLKAAVLASSAIKPIDYSCGRRVILAVDASYIAVGFVLMQVGEDGKRYPSRFGSIPWNDREARYSQAKLELYGLFRALQAYRIWLIGLPKFTVETDAKYIKGMLNNPDIQPNAAVNRWIAAILLFDFDLIHVPGHRHTVPDGLSRRPVSPDDPIITGDVEEWIDHSYGFSMDLLNWSRLGFSPSRPSYASPYLQLPSSHSSPLHPTHLVLASDQSDLHLPRSAKADTRDHQLSLIEAFLRTRKIPEPLDRATSERLIRSASRYFILDDKFWRKNPNGRHQLVMPPAKRLPLIVEAHDSLGHKGNFVTRNRLLDRFWWPFLDHDVQWYTKTCHQCQTRQTNKLFIPPTVPIPASLFRRAHIDTMYLPKSNGYHLLVHARCSLSAYPEWRPLRKETARSVGAFIFEELLCRWGALEEVITDNGPAFIKALDYLAERYGIRHIKISPYNSQGNGIIERQHRSARETLVKAADGEESKWHSVHYASLWAERVSIQRSTGFSPYHIAHGVEPLFPFDLAQATYLVPPLDAPVSTPDLLATRARQLQKRPEDLASIKERVLEARYKSIKHFEKQHKSAIRDYNFGPGTLVLVRNSAIEKELDRKAKPRYFGPMVVVSRSQRGAYTLAELDGAVSKLRYAAFRVIPYYARHKASLPVTRILDLPVDKIAEKYGSGKDLIDLSPDEDPDPVYASGPESDTD